jgi:hypothetical protein
MIAPLVGGDGMFIMADAAKASVLLTEPPPPHAARTNSDVESKIFRMTSRI